MFTVFIFPFYIVCLFSFFPAAFTLTFYSILNLVYVTCSLFFLIRLCFDSTNWLLVCLFCFVVLFNFLLGSKLFPVRNFTIFGFYQMAQNVSFFSFWYSEFLSVNCKSFCHLLLQKMLIFYQIDFIVFFRFQFTTKMCRKSIRLKMFATMIT